MLFVFDENFSKNLAEGMNLLEKSNPGSIIKVDVIATEIFMGRKGADDSEVYEAVGKADGVFFTKDKGFRQIKFYEKIIQENRAKVVFFKSSKKFIFFWDILIALVNRWEELKSKLNEDSSTHVFEFDVYRGISPRPF